MPQYLTPGVYIEEVPGSKPIEGVGTATGAFVGIAEKGPIGQAVAITNWTQFTEVFGGYIPHGYLAYAVNDFFTEGGTRCYVVRTCHYEDITKPGSKTATAAKITLQDRATSPVNTLKVEALSEGSWGDNLAALVEDPAGGDASKFSLAILENGVEVERFDGVTLAGVEGTVNGRSKYVKVANLGSATAAPANRPAVSRGVFVDANKNPSLYVTALAPDLTLQIAAGSTTGTFTLTIQQGGVNVAPSLQNLTLSDVERKVKASMGCLISVAVAPPTAPATATAIPDAATAALPFYALSGGWDGLQGLKLKTAKDVDTLQVSAWQDGETKVEITDAVSDPTNKFKIAVSVNGVVKEEFDDLTMDTAEQVINGASGCIEVNNLYAGPPPANRPANGSFSVPAGLTDSDFIGDEGARNGLRAFDIVDDINIVAIPDRPGDREVILSAYTYCQNRKDCFFVADPPMGLSPKDVLSFKQGTENFSGNAFNSSYAALYYPWISVSDPLTGKNKLVPPSGAVAGTYSYTDVARGVHKAPAGINEGYLNAAVGVERILTKGEQEMLNPNGINAIRSFPGSGIVVWGARTLSADAEMKYVNVRRLLLFIEESVDKGTQWVVFEPNDRSLWAKVKRDVSAFLSVVWQSGALFGSTEEEAFFVKVDDENNPPETRDLGRLVVDIGVAPVKPAEFVIFRIAQKVQGAKG